MAETTNAPKRKRRGHIRPEQVEQRLMEIAERCMEETPRMVYNKSLKQWEEDGSYTFDAANAIKALTEIGKYLGVGEKEQETESSRELRVDFGEHEDYAR